MKQEIRKRLMEKPSYPATCWHCGKPAGTFSRPMKVIHFDCYRYLLWKSRPKPILG